MDNREMEYQQKQGAMHVLGQINEFAKEFNVLSEKTKNKTEAHAYNMCFMKTVSKVRDIMREYGV